MGSGLPGDCRRKNLGFLTPFGAVFGIKNAIGYIKPMASNECQHKEKSSCAVFEF